MAFLYYLTLSLCSITLIMSVKILLVQFDIASMSDIKQLVSCLLSNALIYGQYTLSLASSHINPAQHRLKHNR